MPRNIEAGPSEPDQEKSAQEFYKGEEKFLGKMKEREYEDSRKRDKEMSEDDLVEEKIMAERQLVKAQERIRALNDEIESRKQQG